MNEGSPVGDSNFNVSIERANQTIQGQIRAIKHNTERRIGATIGLDSSVLKWLVQHAVWTMTTFHVGGDGMLAHQRIRGKPFNQQIAAFGEQILFKPTQDRGTTAETRCELAWTVAGSVSSRRRENASLVSCRSTRRRNKKKCWNRDMLS